MLINNPPKELVEAYKNDRLVLFIGSGLSKVFNLPTWSELIIKSIVNIKEKTGDTHLDSLVASLSSGLMPPIQVLEVLEQNNYKKYCLDSLVKELKIDKDNSDFSLHQLIYSFNPKIITTNYDHGFELALGDKVNKINYDSIYKLATKNEHNEYLIKIHGDLDDPEKCILFKNDYEEHYKSEAKAHIFELKKLISDKSILFIGFSNTDPYVKNIFDYINNLYNGYSPKHFLITTDEKFSHSYINKIQIEDYSSGLSGLINELIESKGKEDSINKEQGYRHSIDSHQNLNEQTDTSKELVINILYPDPVDKDYEIRVEPILKSFQAYRVNVFTNYLNHSSLREIDEGYVFIFTRSVKGNIVIEDDYLKSRQMSLSDLLDDYLQDVDGVFLFVDKHLNFNGSEINAPIALFIDDFSVDNKLKNKLASINHKLFRQKSITSDVLINEDKFKYHAYVKGTFKTNFSPPIVSKHLDLKLLNNFVGRKTDVENIVRKFIDLEFENQILTIKGAGGIGKTTIVSKAAIELTKRKIFKEIHFISCQAISTFENFQFQISRCFNLDSSVELEDQIITQYQGKEIVIILDNFETLLNSHECDEVIDLVTFLSDYSMIVTTTRQLLNLEFEEVYELRNMTPSEGTALFKTFFKGVVSEDEEHFLRNEIIDELLNNNPLAIKLIAKGTLPSKELVDLHKELKDNIFQDEEIEKIFEKPEDINIEKSKSLYHSIKYSYDKLNDNEKLTFELLSLFPDGIHFENFKSFSKKHSNKTQIGDKDIKALDDKSLLENSNGFLKLQSIINRFSYFQFKKRDLDTKKVYYTECYKYNSAFEQLFSNGKHYKHSKGLFLHDNNLNNYLKCIEIIDHVDEPKDVLVDFIDSISVVFRNINQYKDLSNVIREKISFFSDDARYKLVHDQFSC